MARWAAPPPQMRAPPTTAGRRPRSTAALCGDACRGQPLSAQLTGMAGPQLACSHTVSSTGRQLYNSWDGRAPRLQVLHRHPASWIGPQFILLLCVVVEVWVAAVWEVAPPAAGIAPVGAAPPAGVMPCGWTAGEREGRGSGGALTALLKRLPSTHPSLPQGTHRGAGHWRGRCGRHGRGVSSGLQARRLQFGVGWSKQHAGSASPAHGR